MRLSLVTSWTSGNHWRSLPHEWRVCQSVCVYSCYSDNINKDLYCLVYICIIWTMGHRITKYLSTLRMEIVYLNFCHSANNVLFFPIYLDSFDCMIEVIIWLFSYWCLYQTFSWQPPLAMPRAVVSLILFVQHQCMLKALQCSGLIYRLI